MIYEDCFKIVQERVYYDRQTNNDPKYRTQWWRYKRPVVELYNTISGLSQVLFHSFVSKYTVFSFVPSNHVYAAPNVVIALPSYESFAALQSFVHEQWVLRYCSTMRGDIRYAPSDLFETFPFPAPLAGLDAIGETYYEHRQGIMLARQEGLTKTYNRFHGPDERSDDIAELRRLHVEMDQAVAAAYGWGDLELGHGFHQTKQGLRYTISEPARRTVLDRLLALNHQRYAEEVAEGLHDKGAKKAAGAKGARKGKAIAEAKTPSPEPSVEQGELF